MPQGQSYPTTFLRSDNFFADPITNNLNPNNPNYPYAGTFAALLLALGYNVRTKAATDYYVDPVAGNDAGMGAIGSPWKTYLHAASVIATLLDFANQTVTLHLVNNATTGLVVPPYTGGGTLVVDLGGKSIASAGGAAIDCEVALPANGVTLQNGSLADSAGSAINHNGVGTINLGVGLTFPASARNHMLCQNTGARILINAGYTISGGVALAHYRTFFSGAAIEAINTITITLTGTPAFGLAFADAEDASLIYFGSGQVKFVGAATGQRYLANKGAVIDTNNGGPNYFPGNAAGAVSGGGQYF